MRRVLNALDNALLAVVVLAAGWFGVDRFVLEHPVGDRPAITEVNDRDALADLAALEVRPASDGSVPYRRRAFGQRWADVDRNGCDTRNDILARDLRAVTFEAGTHNCVVTSGTLDDPYTGERIDFVKGNATSTAVQIDHVVSLAGAWRTGAAAWSDAERLRFANDPRNLLAVSEAVNRAKRDHDAAAWVPEPPAACDYVHRQLQVKRAYGLWVTPDERDALRRVLTTCP